MHEPDRRRAGGPFRRTILLLAPVIVLVSALFPGCSDDTAGRGGIDPMEGTVLVLVTDGVDGPPVEGAEVTLTPDGTTDTTDEDGEVTFGVPSGDYVVHAELCCAGPGWIEYDEPVTVVSGETVIVRLHACLTCQ